MSIDDRRGSAPQICLRSHGHLTRFAASFAYEGEYAVFALAEGGSIGIDLVNGNTSFDWRETARLYLGGAESQRIEQCSPDQQIREFFRAWSGLEARLKCLGLPLQEWTIDLAQQLEQCQIAHVVLEQSYMCAIATLFYAK
ncbi:MAG: 4'-phosphopantetheinyl transferase superfamily protein [Burkholderiales bacterium]|nr:4'-phosphopantetheinyl transferase superfamily protein [Burkholderiales bacterium]